MPKLSDWFLEDTPAEPPAPPYVPDWRPRRMVRREEKEALRAAGRKAFEDGLPKNSYRLGVLDAIHWATGWECAALEAMQRVRAPDEFEVQCYTVFGPLPRLTPRTVGRSDSFYTAKAGHDTPTGWLPGEELHKHRLGHVDYDWRDL